MTTSAPDCGSDSISPAQVKVMLEEGHAVLIDIRAPDEDAHEHISGARLAPLDAIDARDFEREQKDGKAAIFQ